MLHSYSKQCLHPVHKKWPACAAPGQHLYVGEAHHASPTYKCWGGRITHPTCLRLSERSALHQERSSLRSALKPGASSAAPEPIRAQNASLSTCGRPGAQACNLAAQQARRISAIYRASIAQAITRCGLPQIQKISKATQQDTCYICAQETWMGSGNQARCTMPPPIRSCCSNNLLITAL